MQLSTEYMGLKLKNPIVIGSSTFSTHPAKAKLLEAQGAAALVLRSIFEEEIRAEMAETESALASEAHFEAHNYLQSDLLHWIGPMEYLKRLKAIRKVVEIPVIASVNCTSRERWISYAGQLERAGADAIELNIYDIATQPERSAAQIEQEHVELVQAVKARLSCPLAIKIAPAYSSLLNFSKALERAGADAIVLFNRFFQPDIDIHKLKINHQVNFSSSNDLLLPLRWTAIMRPHLKCHMALTTGVHSAEDLIKALLAGADVVQIASILYREGPKVIPEMLRGLKEWMEAQGFGSIGDFQGRISKRGQGRYFERAQYIKTLLGCD